MHGKTIFEKIIIKIITIYPGQLMFFVEMIEYYYAFSLSKSREYVDLQKKWLRKETNTVNFRKTDKILFIGAGSVPYTAIILSTVVEGDIYVLEKNLLACLLGRALLVKLGLSNKIFYINSSSLQYRNYQKYDWIYIASYTYGKLQTVQKILKNTGKIKLIVRGEDFRLLENDISVRDTCFDNKELVKIKKNFNFTYKKYKNTNSYFFIIKKR